jgi:hypothetical protein
MDDRHSHLDPSVALRQLPRRTYPLPSTPRSSLYNLLTLLESIPSTSRTSPSSPLDDPSRKPYGDSQPFATTEISTADILLARHPSSESLPPPTDRRIGATSLSLSLFLH